MKFSAVIIVSALSAVALAAPAPTLWGNKGCEHYRPNKHYSNDWNGCVEYNKDELKYKTSCWKYQPKWKECKPDKKHDDKKHDDKKHDDKKHDDKKHDDKKHDDKKHDDKKHDDKKHDDKKHDDKKYDDKKYDDKKYDDKKYDDKKYDDKKDDKKDNKPY